MSWHYLQELEEVSSEAISWDGSAFVPSKSKNILGGYCLPDNETASCPDSPYGMTLKHSTGKNGEAVLMWFQGDSPVRTYLPPVEVPESVVESVVDYGPSLPGSLARYNPGSYSWKTAQCSLFGGLTLYSGTWPRWGMMQNGELFPRKTPVLGTNGKGSGYWPTPCTTDYKGSGVNGQLRDRLDYAVERGGTKTRQNFPTPRCFMAHGVKRTKETMFRNLEDCVAEPKKLNPSWVEWLMGWPIGWTALKPLAMDKFQQWLDLHGEY